ncbi:phosphoglycerate mutase [Enterococcus florum]|uniref:phosphoglycerate mutase (2,3-diphosphoglycerate-dependent) n=1 Tax=Enterococcus florum TaxID=2480627 RepID=A0A4P5PDC1_9ENTE|nr:histidine phosphatase family protein [Enterococcus florum]GCF94018.1 phosphoglycerate mutase [Enterococcus florum]
MKLYFTRHGKTEWNKERRFQGMMGDSPLLPESYLAIEKLGQTLGEIPFEVIYSSSSKRAYVTAEGIRDQLKHPVEIVRTDELKEMGLGDLEGRSIETMRKRYGENLDHLRHHLDCYDPTPFGGEKVDQMLERMTRTIKHAVKNAKEGPLLFVGHGSSMTAAIQYLSGKPVDALRAQGGLFNNSLSILETQGSNQAYKMVKWNDIDFLNGLGDTPDAIL